MYSLPRGQNLPIWNKLWNATEQEFFKVEEMQDYTDEDNDQQSSLHLWLKGDKKGSLALINQYKNEWSKFMAAKEITKIRVHIVDEPFTDYLSWEIEHYKLVNIPLGKELVYLVNRSDVPDYNLGDFMMFDNEAVARSHYSAGGRMQKMDFYENEPIEQFLAAKTLLMKHAKKIIA